MKCQEIIEVIEQRFPREYACDWDNVGLLCGDRAQEVQKVFLALDATCEVVDAAIAAGADFLITHHPMIFGGIKSVTAQDSVGSRLIRLIRGEVSYYAMHTNYDSMGMADLSARILELQETSVLEVVYNGEGCGRVGELTREMTLRECAALVKERFHLPNVKVFGDLEKPVKRAGLLPGSGKSMARLAWEQGADVMITGDIDHHTGIDMKDLGMAIIDAGHYGLEHIFIEDMRAFLAAHFPELTVETMPIVQPFEVI